LARKKKGRALSGVLLLDKPQGMTSNFALQKVRRLFGAQKAGHTGSLDPLATGVLPICFGEATKFSKYLLDADKGYFTTATLGEVRDTGDSDGQMVSQCPVPELSEVKLLAIFSQFSGDILQVPSMYSALKHKGRPLYEYARKGITIERPARPVSIMRLEMTDKRTDCLDLTVECTKGTYIRSLVEDIGQSIGCGAHVSMLRRFKAGHFSLTDAVTMAQIEASEGDDVGLDSFLLPVDCLLPDFPQITVNNALGESLLHGQAVRIPAFEKAGLNKLYISLNGSAAVGNSDSDETSRFSGMVEVLDDGTVQPKRLVNFEPACQADIE